jgi:glucan phosphorylase
MLELAKWFRSNKHKSFADYKVSLGLKYKKITITQIKQLVEYKRNIAMTLRDDKKNKTKLKHDRLD